MRILLLLIPTIAAADVGGELAAGTGGETEGSGYGVATVSGHASYEHAAPAFDKRGLHMCEPGGGCLWIFTGIDPDEVDGSGVNITGQALLRPDEAGGTDASALVSGEAWAGSAGWKLTVRGDIQPVGDLRDGFWRSGRGIYSRNIRVDIPGMWGMGNEDQQLVVIPGHVALGELTSREAGEWHHAGFDRDIGLVAFRWQSKYHTFDLCDMEYREWGVKESELGGVTYGHSADTVDINASLRLRVMEQLELYGRGGITSPSPVSAFMITGTSESSTGPFTMAGDLWGEARLALGDNRATLGGGTWTRIDPTGHAVDHGHAVEANFTRTSDRVELHGAVRVGKLERVLLGALAPPEIAPKGTQMWMGRGAIDASVRVMRSVRVAATAWVERSDRDDPRWLAPGTKLATRAGADVSMTWRFEAIKR